MDGVAGREVPSDGRVSLHAGAGAILRFRMRRRRLPRTFPFATDGTGHACQSMYQVRSM